MLRCCTQAPRFFSYHASLHAVYCGADDGADGGASGCTGVVVPRQMVPAAAIKASGLDVSWLAAGGASRLSGLALVAFRRRCRTRALLAALVWHEAHSSRPRRLCMAVSERTSGSSGPLQAVHDGPRPVALREAFMGRVSAVVNVRRYLRTGALSCGGSLSVCLRARLSG